jgi:DNA-binding MarR family transcriptional regulator
MTIVVDDLERQGLVARKPHPTDRRAKLVEATARGREAAQRARVILNRPPAELTALPEDELAALLRGLRAIRPGPASVNEPDADDPVTGPAESRTPPPKR